MNNENQGRNISGAVTCTTVVAILIDPYQPDCQLVVNAIRSYRDLYRLNWDVRIVEYGRASRVPIGAHWVVSSRHACSHIPPEHSTQRVISLTEETGWNGLNCCRYDEEGYGKLAARHLCELGYRSLAAVKNAMDGQREQRRLSGFIKEAATHRSAIHTLNSKSTDSSETDRHVVQQIRNLIHPAGIYCTTDSHADWLRDQLLDAGLDIPEQIALVGTGNHLPTCTARNPFLSSVATPWPLIGQAAARMLHSQIQGTELPEPVSVRPFLTEVRASTRQLSPKDPLIAEGLAWLQKNLGAKRPLASLSTMLNTSQATITRRFKEELHIGPKRALDHLRIKLACDLLRTTQLSITQISRRCGFTNSTSFGVSFRRLNDCTPSEYRELAATTDPTART